MHGLLYFSTIIFIVHAKKNVLFFAVDDLRPELGVYEGQDFPSPVYPKIHSPNIDKLASRSLVLMRSYCQQALCSPSRTSLLTGRRPDTTHVYDLQHYFRKVGGNFTTIPEYFKNNGYTSVGMGKIFHPGKLASGFDDPVSWSEPYYHGVNNWESKKLSNDAIPDEKLKDKPLVDQQVAEHARQTLQRLAPTAKSGGKPFFVAVGFHKPHLLFVFPKTFLDFYPEESIRLPPNAYAPVNMPPVAWNRCVGLLGYNDIRKLHFNMTINTTFPDSTVKELRRAYYSALTYTDSLVGSVIDELDALGLRNETIISFWGDHGWQLGEHGEWCKQTNFELATHAPMMISIPGKTDSGIVSRELTEFVDLFPTLAEAAGLEPLPLCPENSTSVALCREGVSLLPLTERGKTVWKNATFSQYTRNVNGTPVMGYTMRTDQYRYTEWVKFDGEPVYKPDWTSNFGTELYDHYKDPEENVNHAGSSDYKKVQTLLQSMLHKGWRSVIPP